MVLPAIAIIVIVLILAVVFGFISFAVLLNFGLVKIIGLALLLFVAYNVFIKGNKVDKKNQGLIITFTIIGLLLLLNPFGLFTGFNLTITKLIQP